MQFISTIHGPNNEPIYFVADHILSISELMLRRFEPVECEPIEWTNIELIEQYISKEECAHGRKSVDGLTGYKMVQCTF